MKTYRRLLIAAISSILLFAKQTDQSLLADPSLSKTLQRGAPSSESADLLDPHAFGDCDWSGSHDVAPCIQAAINAGSEISKGVRIPGGNWPLGQYLNIPSNTTLLGENARTTLRPTSSNDTGPILLQVMNAAKVSVQNIIFDGGGRDFANPKPVIDVSHSESVIFDQVSVVNARGTGLAVHDEVSKSGVRNSRFLDVGNHWKTTLNRSDRLQGLVFCCGNANNDNFATGNYFEDIGLDALQFSKQFHFIATDNVFKLENNEYALIKSPDFPAAIFAMYNANSIISNNTISGAQGCGIDAPALKQSLISRNKINNSGGCGIGLFQGYDKTSQTSNVVLTENTITDNVHWRKSPFKGGVTIAGGTPSNITLSGNTITNTDGNRSQLFGVQVLGNTKVNGLMIDRDNRLDGNAISAFDPASFPGSQ